MGKGPVRRRVSLWGLGRAVMEWNPCWARAAPCWPVRRPQSPTQGSAVTPNRPWSCATCAATGRGAWRGPGHPALEPGGPSASPRKPLPICSCPVLPARWEPTAASAWGVPAQELRGTAATNRRAGGVLCRGAQSRSALRAWAPASPARFSERASASPVSHPSTSPAACASARRPAARREPGAIPRAIPCPSARVPARVVPSARALPQRRATCETGHTAPQAGPCCQGIASWWPPGAPTLPCGVGHAASEPGRPGARVRWRPCPLARYDARRRCRVSVVPPRVLCAVSIDRVATRIRYFWNIIKGKLQYKRIL